MSFQRIAVLATALFIFLAAAPTQQQDPAKVVASLHWTRAPLHLNTSNSTVVPPPHTSALQGADAQTFEKLNNDESTVNPNLEAAIVARDQLVYVDYDDEGYVTVDDWKTVDPNAMLKDITDNTEESNAERKSHGGAPIHVIGWIQKPTYDPRTKTVRWALTARVEGEQNQLVNATALVLGRHGYEKFTWVGDRPAYTTRGGLLDRVIASYHFNPGARYQDFISGDKLAGYGIAALVGTAAGATIAKTVGFGGLLLLIKKLWILIVAGIAGAYRWLRAKFQRPPSSTQGTP